MRIPTEPPGRRQIQRNRRPRRDRQAQDFLGHDRSRLMSRSRPNRVSGARPRGKNSVADTGHAMFHMVFPARIGSHQIDFSYSLRDDRSVSLILRAPEPAPNAVSDNGQHVQRLFQIPIVPGSDRISTTSWPSRRDSHSDGTHLSSSDNKIPWFRCPSTRLRLSRISF